jgi:hypothetical protein
VKNKPQFPGKIFDGTATDRGSRTINAAPDYPSYDQLVAELIATQERVQELEAGGGEVLSAESDESISAGMPVVVKTNGHLARAQNSDPARYQVAGIALAEVAPTFAGNYASDGLISLEDWSAVTGSATLSVGATYFLSDVIGQLTITAPQTSGLFVVRIGRAVTTSTLAIELGQPIKL